MTDMTRSEAAELLEALYSRAIADSKHIFETAGYRAAAARVGQEPVFQQAKQVIEALRTASVQAEPTEAQVLTVVKLFDDPPDWLCPLLSDKSAGMHDAAQRLLKAAAIPAPGQVSDEMPWRCFHCNEVFTDREAAADHFGVQIDGLADDCACKLNATDGLLLKMLRESQEELRRYENESDPQSLIFYSLGAKHVVALREEEQKGYDRGLADGRAEALQASQTASVGEDAVERVARAIDPSAWAWLDRTDPSHIAYEATKTNRLETAQRAIQAARMPAPVVEGWVMVPMTPTPEILDAAFNTGIHLSLDDVKRLYTAMLASPRATGETGNG